MYTFTLFATLAATGVWGHGRLTKPVTRKPHGYENDPTSGPNGTDFICRNDPNHHEKEKVEAGGYHTFHWWLSAPHVGDCSIYISYSDAAINGKGNDKRESRWLKIANVFDCKRYNNEDVQIHIPGWLPAGEAVIRWEWQALHVHPAIEFYAQCADVIIVSDTTTPPELLPTYKIVDPELLPVNHSVKPGFRNPFHDTEQYYTGPPCAFPGQAADSNQCELTEPDTTGHIDVTDRINDRPDPASAPTHRPTNDPDTPVMNPTEPPNVGPSPVPGPTGVGPSPTFDPNGCGGPWAACGGESNPDAPTCCMEGWTCYAENQWFFQCRNDGCPDGWDCEHHTLDCDNSAWSTCGGKSNPDANQCCPAGYACYAQNEWFSQCREACPEGWMCNNEEKETPSASCGEVKKRRHCKMPDCMWTGNKENGRCIPVSSPDKESYEEEDMTFKSEAELVSFIEKAGNTMKRRACLSHRATKCSAIADAGVCKAAGCTLNGKVCSGNFSWDQ